MLTAQSPAVHSFHQAAETVAGVRAAIITIITWAAAVVANARKNDKKGTEFSVPFFQWDSVPL
jgi:hypothetical protein